MSEPQHEGSVEIGYVRVPMRDGVELGAKITRPVAAGEYPAVMEYNAYRRISQPLPDYREEYPPVVPFLAERGYAIVQFDVRGTGTSGGSTCDIYSDLERRDGYEMVEWIAAQPWCNGNVGMIGKSYGGVVQWQVAVQNPPHLKAIIVRSANDDIYTEWVYPGGCLRPYMLDCYSTMMNALNFAPPDPDLVEESWQEAWDERLADSRPWGIGYVSHPLDGPYWHDRSLSFDYGRVRCPVYVVAGWSDVYPTALLRAYTQLDVPKRALVGPWGHWYAEEAVAVPGPRIDSRIEYLKWFDHWLKGLENGVMDELPVRLFVQDYHPPATRMPLEQPGRWRTEHDWPIPRTRRETLFFQPDGELDVTPPVAETSGVELVYDPTVGITSGIHWGGGILPWAMPTDQRLDEAKSLLWTSIPLEEDLEVTGNPTAILYVSSTAEVAYFRVKLIDVAPDGTSKLVRYGGLNATHRHSHADPEPLVPGERYELEIPLKAMSYVFATGHRIRVAIAGADFQNAWPVAAAGVHTVYTGPDCPTRIELPVIPPPESPLPDPGLIELPPADPAMLNAPTEHSITHDLVEGTVTVRLGREDEGRGSTFRQHSAFTVSAADPARAVLRAGAVFSLRRPDREVTVEATETTTSDATEFVHEVTVAITLNGEPYFGKNWSVSVPRALN